MTTTSPDTRNEIQVNLVTPAGFAAFPRSHRHGPLLRCIIFAETRKHLNSELIRIVKATKPEHLKFRDVVFACLFLASAGHVELLRGDCTRIKRPKMRNDYNVLTRWECEEEEHVAYLFNEGKVRSHPGPAPSAATFWLRPNDLLVHFVPALDNPKALKQAITFVRTKAPVKSRNWTFLALLMSSEHVVMLQMYCEGNTCSVDCTAPLTLFQTRPWDLREHKDRRTRTRSYTPPYTRADKLERDSGLETFFSLAWFLEVAARRSLPARSTNGVLPMETYAEILHYISDMKTYRACLRVSHQFRDLCLERCLINDDSLSLSLTTNGTTQKAGRNASEAMARGYLADAYWVYFDTSTLMFVSDALDLLADKYRDAGDAERGSLPREKTPEHAVVRIEANPRKLGLPWMHRWQVLLGEHFGRRTVLPYTWLSLHNPAGVWANLPYH